jgi:hypothetical protein
MELDLSNFKYIELKMASTKEVVDAILDTCLIQSETLKEYKSENPDLMEELEKKENK